MSAPPPTQRYLATRHKAEAEGFIFLAGPYHLNRPDELAALLSACGDLERHGTRYMLVADGPNKAELWREPDGYQRAAGGARSYKRRTPLAIRRMRAR